MGEIDRELDDLEVGIEEVDRELDMLSSEVLSAEANLGQSVEIDVEIGAVPHTSLDLDKTTELNKQTHTKKNTGTLETSDLNGLNDQQAQEVLESDDDDADEVMMENDPNDEKVSRLERMRLFRNKMMVSRKQSRLRPVETELKLKAVHGGAKTTRGERVLKASDVEQRLVQDKSNNMIVIGSDVEALYPSLVDTQVAEIVFRAVMETDVKIEGVSYQEGVRYIALNSTAKDCRTGELRRVLPWRRHVNGTRPGITGEGPMGAEVGDQEQWVFPKVELTDREKRLIIATVMKIAVLVLFKSHVYTFGGKFYLQKHGGPIGLRSTCAIARIVMLDWI